MADTKTTLTWLLKDEVTGRAKHMRDALDDTGKKAAGAQGPLGSLGGAITGLINPMTLAIGGAAALGAGLVTAVKSAAEEQINVEKLNAALEANIEGWNGNTDAIEEVIKERENLAFSDDDQRSSLALLVAGTKDVEEAQRLQTIAMDLARLKGVDLATATTAVAKASQGSTKELKAMGIEFAAGASGAEVLAQVSEAAAGQAEAYAETTAGKWETLQIKFGDVVEEVGMFLLPILTDLLSWVIDEAIPAFEEFARIVGPVLKEAFRVVGAYISWWVDNIVKPTLKFIGDLIGTVQNAIGFLQTLGLVANANLPAYQTAGRTAGRIPHRQHGGPVEAGGTYLVGESGPELLQMGSRSGNVIPGGGNITVHIPVMLNGREIASVVDTELGKRLRSSTSWV